MSGDAPVPTRELTEEEIVLVLADGSSRLSAASTLEDWDLELDLFSTSSIGDEARAIGQWFRVEISRAEAKAVLRPERTRTRTPIAPLLRKHRTATSSALAKIAPGHFAVRNPRARVRGVAFGLTGLLAFSTMTGHPAVLAAVTVAIPACLIGARLARRPELRTPGDELLTTVADVCRRSPRCSLPALGDVRRPSAARRTIRAEIPRHRDGRRGFDQG